MKSILPFFFFCSFLTLSLNGQMNSDKPGKVEVIKEFKYLYRYQNYYIGGQPTIEALQWLKSQGVSRIISLRTESENTEYSDYAYNEKANAEKLGFEYFSLPVDGNKDYTPEKLEALSKLINPNEKVLIHCLTAGRATNLFMAYLIKYKGYTPNEAVEIGRDLRFSLPLETLLGTKVNMEIVR